MHAFHRPVRFVAAAAPRVSVAPPMGVGPRAAAIACLVGAIVGGCEHGKSQASRCKDLVRAGAPDAISVCRAAFASDHSPKTAGQLAYALANTEPIDVDAVRVLADQVGDQPDGAEVWHQLGEALRMANREGAFDAYVRALAHRSETDVRGRAEDEYSIYDRLMRREDFQSAAEHLANANQLVNASGDSGLRVHITLGTMTFFLELGDLRAADRIGRVAAELVQRDSPYYPVLRMNQAQLELADHHYDLAVAACREMIELAHETDDPVLEHEARTDLVYSELLRGDTEAASIALAPDPAGDNAEWRATHAYVAAQLAYAQGRYADAEQVAASGISDEVVDWRARLLTQRGRALVALGRVDEARIALTAAVDVIEGEREALSLDELKTWLAAERRQPYEALFAIAASRGDADEALTIAQAATARTFLDTLIGDHAATDEHTEIGAAATGAARRIEAIRAIARSVRASPAVAPIGGKALMSKLAAQTVLSYFFADDAAWLLVIAHGQARLHRLSLGRSALSELQSRWIGALDDSVLARQLGDALVPPEARPARGTRVYIAPDDFLHQLPFAALIVGDHRLVERYDLAQVPSASVLAALADVPPARGPSVVIGDPTDDLPGARAEAATAAAALGVEPVIGPNARRDAVLGAGGARVLHLAAHSRIDGDQPALVLADGSLAAGEILDARLAPGVVVAATCASEMTPGREAWGALATSFLASGSTVVASRWSIADAQAAEDMNSLYRAGIDDPIHAVATVQREALAAGRPVSTWAAYVVLGRGTSPQPTGGSR